MIQFPIQATIFYSHSEDEIRELAQAIEPMGEHIRAVGSDTDRQRLRAILLGNHFRRRDVTTVKNMLLRAAKHARAHMGEYFPALQHSVVVQAEVLENAAQRYAKRFKSLETETIAVH